MSRVANRAAGAAEDQGSAWPLTPAPGRAEIPAPVRRSAGSPLRQHAEPTARAPATSARSIVLRCGERWASSRYRAWMATDVAEHTKRLPSLSRLGAPYLLPCRRSGARENEATVRPCHVFRCYEDRKSVV